MRERGEWKREGREKEEGRKRKSVKKREGEGRMVKSSTVYTLGLKLEEKRKGKREKMK